MADFGSGGGIDCFLAAKVVGVEGRVIGVDMTPDMVELARSNAVKLGLSNVEFHLSEMESTPIEDASVDVLISNCVINLAPDKDAVFREAFRILKPGGRVYISDMLLVKELPEAARADMSNWVACLGGAEPVEVYLGRMRGAGFSRGECHIRQGLGGVRGVGVQCPQHEHQGIQTQLAKTKACPPHRGMSAAHVRRSFCPRRGQRAQEYASTPLSQLVSPRCAPGDH